MDQLLYIAFGWLLGLLSPVITEKIRRAYRRKDLHAGITGELLELQYKMALVSYRLRSHSGILDDQSVRWMERIVLAYKGPEPNQDLLQALEKLRKLPEGDRRHFLAIQKRSPDKAIGLLQYALPFVTAHGGELLIFPVRFQSEVLRIKSQLDMFNQRVVFLQKQFDRSFDSGLSQFNQEAIRSNLDDGYRELALQAERIADLIANIS